MHSRMRSAWGFSVLMVGILDTVGDYFLRQDHRAMQDHRALGRITVP